MPAGRYPSLASRFFSQFDLALVLGSCHRSGRETHFPDAVFVAAARGGNASASETIFSAAESLSRSAFDAISMSTGLPGTRSK
jgi:hypothetical protein